MHQVYRLVRRLGISPKYVGYYYTVEAVRIYLAQTEDPVKITKDIYPPLARKFRVNPSKIDHGIRRVSALCWENSRENLEEIAGRPLSRKPDNSCFLDILSFYLSSVN